MTTRVKYPRTPHLPFSLGRTNDDKVLDNLDHFIGKNVIITEKLDGECSTIYPDYYSHARSLDSVNHPSRDWLKKFHSEIAHKMENGTRICGENVYAKHSIEYDELESYFYGFSLWSDDGWCFSWEMTKIFFEEIGITSVPEIWRGLFDEHKVREIANNLNTTKQEGFVIRLMSNFRYEDFSKSVAKYVRTSHVQSNEHWMHQQIIPNKLKQEKI